MENQAMTGNELLAILKKNNPNRTFAITKKGTTIGVWSDKAGRYNVILAVNICDNKWCECPDLLVNGQPAVKAEDWVEYAPYGLDEDGEPYGDEAQKAEDERRQQYAGGRLLGF